MSAAFCILLAALAGPASTAATGRVVGPGGVPIPGAQVCEFVEGSPERCVSADGSGVYRMEAPKRAQLFVRAVGYVPQTIDAAPLTAPVELQLAAVLEVTVVDAVTKRPLNSGRVMLDSPSGRRIGKFVPFNKHGVRISTLEPGVIFVRVEAEGYEPAGPIPVTLISGSPSSIKVPLTKSDGTGH